MLKLKQMKIWLCWNYIEVKGKKTKNLLQPEAVRQVQTASIKKHG